MTTKKDELNLDSYEISFDTAFLTNSGHRQHHKFSISIQDAKKFTSF